MIATRASIVAELVITGAMTALVALFPPRAAPAPVHREELRVVHVELMSASPAKLDRSAPLPPRLAAMYARRDFAALERSLGDCRDMKQLLQQLERSWAIAVDRHETLDQRFQATHDVLELDIAFGGAHTAELEQTLGDLAREYNRDHPAEAAARRARLDAALNAR
jgi:hypothetical protein